MTRTSLHLSPARHARLRIVSKHRRKLVPATLSALIAKLLEHALAAHEHAQLRRVYDGLAKLDGLGSNEIRDGSTSLNELLYGEPGAWRGSAQNEGD